RRPQRPATALPSPAASRRWPSHARGATTATAAPGTERAVRAARILLALLLAGGAGPALAAGAGQRGSADAGEPARGRYLGHAGGCLSCHTAEHADAVPLAGGRALPTPCGPFYAPNITPDPDTGIGGWSVDDV